MIPFTAVALSLTNVDVLKYPSYSQPYSIWPKVNMFILVSTLDG